MQLTVYCEINLFLIVDKFKFINSLSKLPNWVFNAAMCIIVYTHHYKIKGYLYASSQ